MALGLINLKKSFALIVFLLLIFPVFFSNSNAVIGGISPSAAIAVSKSSQHNLFTGDLTESISLMSVPGRNGYSFPINVTYSAPIMLEQESSWVGLGWNLSAGKVSRQINGLPDDSEKGYLAMGQNTAERFHPDNFFVSFPEGSAQIVFDSDLGHTPFTIPWKPWKIVPIFGSAFNSPIVEWEITTESGKKYIFSQTASTKIVVDSKTYLFRKDYQELGNVWYFAPCPINQNCCPGNPNFSIYESYCMKNPVEGAFNPYEFNYSYPDIIPFCGTEKNYWRFFSAKADIKDRQHFGWTAECVLSSEPVEYIYEWGLTEIISPDYEDSNLDNELDASDKGNWVKIIYDKVSGVHFQTASMPVSYNSEPLYFGIKGDSSDPNFEWSYDSKRDRFPRYNYWQYSSVESWVDFIYISKIETPTHEAIFLTAPRSDLSGTKRLSSIELKRKGNSTVISAVDFDNDQYELASGAHGGLGKMNLKEIKFFGLNKANYLPAYKFQYNYNPSYNQWAFDNFGFYNGASGNGDLGCYGTATNPIFTCSNSPLKFQQNLCLSSDAAGCQWRNNNFSPSISIEASAWALTRIDYPAGSWKEFQFEPDKYNYVQGTNVGETTGGGIRVKSIAEGDGLGHTSTTTYTYSDGVLSVQPKIEDGSYFAFTSIAPNSSIFVGYSKVTIALPSDNGKKEIYFSTQKDSQFRDEDIDSKGNPHTFFSWKQGLVLEEKNFKEGDSNPVSSTVFNYDLSNSSNHFELQLASCDGNAISCEEFVDQTSCLAQGQSCSWNNGCHNTSQTKCYNIPDEVNCNKRNACSWNNTKRIVSDYPRLSSINSTIDGITSTTVIEQNPVNGLVSKIIQTNSDGTVKISKNIFAFEESSPANNALTSQHILDKVVSAKVYQNSESDSNLKSFSKTSYSAVEEMQRPSTTLAEGIEAGTLMAVAVNDFSFFKPGMELIVCHGSSDCSCAIGENCTVNGVKAVIHSLDEFGSQKFINFNQPYPSSSQAFSAGDYVTIPRKARIYPQQTSDWLDLGSAGYNPAEDRMVKSVSFDSYDNFGQVLQSSDVDGKASKYFYGDNSNNCDNGASGFEHSLLTCTENSKGQKTELDYDELFFKNNLVKDSQTNAETIVSFDDFGRAQGIQNPLDSTPSTSISYYLAGSSISSSNPNKITTVQKINASLDSVSASFLDGFGKEIQTAAIKSSSQSVRLGNELDELLSLEKQSKAVLGGSVSGNDLLFESIPSSAEKAQLLYEQSPLHRSLGLIPAGSTQQNYSIAYGKSESKQTVSVTDCLGNTSTAFNDKFGNTVKTVFADNNYATFEYDVLGNLTSAVNQKNQQTIYAYDSLGNLKSINAPDSGLTSFTYYDNGLTESKTDARGKATHYYYDELNRIELIDFEDGISEAMPRKSVQQLSEEEGIGDESSPEGSQEVDRSFYYDSYSGSCAFLSSNPNSSFVSGNLAMVSDETGTTCFLYDKNRRTIKLHRIILGFQAYAIDLFYDSAGNIERIKYPDNSSACYYYNKLNQTESVKFDLDKDGVCETPLISSIEYYPNSLIKRIVYANGVQTDIEFTSKNEIKRISSINSLGEQVFFKAYTYDCTGNLIKENSSNSVAMKENRAKACMIMPDGGGCIPVTPSKPKTETNYSYDNLNRLTKMTGALPYEYDIGISYNYDALGNIVSKTEKGLGMVSNAFYSGKNQLQTSNSTQYYYDLAGNLSQKVEDGKTTSYQFSFAGNLKKIIYPVEPGIDSETETFYYDYLNRKVKSSYTKKAGGHTYGDTIVELFLDSNPVYQISGVGTKRFVYANGQLIASIDSSNNISYYHLDFRNNVVAKTDSRGIAIALTEFTPFGKLYNPEGESEFGFLSKEFNAKSKLNYLLNREYSSATERFISVDPIYSPTQSPYAYSYNNPLKFSDPSGLAAGDSFAPIGLGYYVGANGEIIPMWMLGYYIDWSNIPTKTYYYPGIVDTTATREETVMERQWAGLGPEVSNRSEPNLFVKAYGSSYSAYKKNIGGVGDAFADSAAKYYAANTPKDSVKAKEFETSRSLLFQVADQLDLENEAIASGIGSNTVMVVEAWATRNPTVLLGPLFSFAGGEAGVSVYRAGKYVNGVLSEPAPPHQYYGSTYTPASSAYHYP